MKKKIIIVITLFVIFLLFITFVILNNDSSMQYYLVSKGKLYYINKQEKLKKELLYLEKEDIPLYINSELVCKKVKFINFENGKIIVFNEYDGNTYASKLNVISIDRNNDNYEHISNNITVYMNSKILYNNGKYYCENRYSNCMVKYVFLDEFSKLEAIGAKKYDYASNDLSDTDSFISPKYEVKGYNNEELSKVRNLVYIKKYDENYIQDITKDFDKEFEKLKNGVVKTDKDYDLYFYEISISNDSKLTVKNEYEFLDNGDRFTYKMNQNCYFDEYLHQNKLILALEKNNLLKRIYIIELEDENKNRYMVSFSVDYV